MAKVIAPNNQYTGLSAGVTFVNGVGECADPYLLGWFKSKGYTVEEPETSNELDRMDPEELKAYAEANGIDIGQATSQNGILKKIREAEATEEDEDENVNEDPPEDE